MLQPGNGVRRPHVLLAAHAVGILAARRQRMGQLGLIAVGGAVHAQRLFAHVEDVHALDVAGRAGEIAIDQFARQTHRLEHLRPGIRHVGGDAHLGHHLAQPLANGLDVVGNGLFRRQFRAQLAVHVNDGLHGQVGVDSLGPVAGQHGEVMHLACRARLDHQAGVGAQPTGNQVLVHGRQGQQRRNGHVIAVHGPVGDDEDVVAVAHRVHGIGTQGGQPRLDAVTPPGHRVAARQLQAAELAVGEARDVAQPRHLRRPQDGLVDFQPQWRVDVVDVQQVGLGADEAHQRHHHFLADRVDGRVRDLCETLLEVVVEGLVVSRQHRDRRVGAHRADGFLAVERHRCHQELDVLLRVAEGLLAVQQRFRRLWHAVVIGAGHLVQTHAQRVDPLPVGLGGGQLRLDLAVVDDAPLLQVDQEHLAGLQPPFLDDARIRDLGQHAGFRRHHHQIVFRHQVACRPQAVAVQRGTDLPAIGEGQRRGAVPRLHHCGVIFIEGPPRRVHGRMLLPGLGNHHHHRVGHRIARHGEQLQHVVEAGRVRLAGEDQRIELLQVGTQHRRGHRALAGTDPVVVAVDGVDLAVVRHHPERVRQLPRREGVGGKALVHQGQRRGAAQIGQILVVDTHLVGQQQALVDNGARRHRRHEIGVAELQVQVLDAVRRTLAQQVQAPLQRILHHHVLAPSDEELTDDGFGVAHQRRHRHVGIHRHVTPAQHHQAFIAHGALQLLLTGGARSRFTRQEDHAHAIFARWRQRHALGSHLLAQQCIRNLQQHPGPVTEQRIGPGGAAMVEVEQDAQPVLHDLVALAALDVCHEADAAGIVLVDGVVHPLRGGQRPGLEYRHGFSPGSASACQSPSSGLSRTRYGRKNKNVKPCCAMRKLGSEQVNYQ